MTKRTSKQLTQRRRSIWLGLVMLLLLSLACGSVQPKPVGPANATFYYQVNLSVADGANVDFVTINSRIDVAGKPPVQGRPDSSGFIAFDIPMEYAGDTGNLMIQLDGYRNHTAVINLREDMVATAVTLQLIGSAVAPNPSPTPSTEDDTSNEPNAEATAQAEANAQATATAEAQANVQATAEALRETQAQAQAEATATAEAQAIADTEATATAEAQAIADAEATATALAQAEAEREAQKEPVTEPEPAPPAATLSGKLAFNLKLGNEYKTYVVQMEDNPSGQLYASLGHAWQPSLSSDGRYLLVNGTGGGRDQLYRYNSNGHNGVRVSCEGITITSEFPTFSPDGSQYAFDGRQVDAARPQIYYHSLAEDCDLGDNRLSINGGDAVEQNGFHPVWGTDNWLYFRSCATWPGGTNGNCGVWGKQMNGDGFRQVSNNPNHLPTDAKGQWLLLTFNNGGVWDVYRVSTQGGNALNLSKSQSIDIWGTISPDGQTVAFISNRSGYWAIWLMDIDGSNPREWQSIKQLEWGGIPTDEIPGGRMSWSR